MYRIASPSRSSPSSSRSSDRYRRTYPLSCEPPTYRRAAPDPPARAYKSPCCTYSTARKDTAGSPSGPRKRPSSGKSGIAGCSSSPSSRSTNNSYTPKAYGRETYGTSNKPTSRRHFACSSGTYPGYSISGSFANNIPPRNRCINNNWARLWPSTCPRTNRYCRGSDRSSSSAASAPSRPLSTTSHARRWPS